ncbi:MAG TPA: iron-containing redox enzyme family protein [Polyangiaceae bacterium]|nr:iron-containing redox enzyme family protein [Polyangiaceae bacterium]
MKATLDAAVSAMDARSRLFPWTDRAAYAGWLAQTYYYVRHSTRLLAAAAARFPHGRAGDTLHHRFGAHIGEEKRHELLCVRDIQALGETLEGYPEHATTRMFYEPQYYKVEHQTPSVLLGYILPLEVIAPLSGTLVIEQLTQAFGPKCANFLKVHAQEDVAHVDRALGLVEALPSQERELIEQNMKQTAFAYVAMLDAIAPLTGRSAA